MEQDLKKIENLYDTVARECAETFSGDHERKPKDREMLRKFAEEVWDRRPVWDLGCGPGQTTSFLKDLGIDISGLDLSEKILDEARTLHPALHFQKGNMLDLEFQNDSIAGIVAFYAIVHFTEGQVRKAFNEVFRVLQSGGLFLVTYHIGEEMLHLDEFLDKSIDIDVMFFTPDFISDCLKRCGFERIELFEREPYPGIEYESRRAYVFARKP